MRTGVLVLGIVAALLSNGAEPPEFDLVIEAETFARGTVKAVAGTGWADAGGIIQCADQSPDWAEWDFAVDEAGVYSVYGKVAADASRPVHLSVDGTAVNARALDSTTGSWRSSQAQWFPVGFAVLKQGNHTLRIQRGTCIPHIDAFGLVKMTEFDMSKGVFEVPEELWLDDGYPIQDWMIWTIGGIEQFEVRDGAYRIVNGRHTLNRPLYATNGPETVFAGDRPVVAFVRGATTKLGALGVEAVTADGRKWLDEAERIEFAYDGARVGWRVTDPLWKDGRVDIEVVALEDAPGFLVRAAGPEGVRLSWWYGGLRGGYPDNKAGTGPLPGGRNEEDCAGNVAEVLDGMARLANPEVDGAEAFLGVAPGGTVADCAVEKGAAIRAEAESGGGRVYVAVADRAASVEAALADPEAAWQAATAHYEAIAARLDVESPDPVLGAAMRGNNAAMDGQYRPPSYLHGALRWGTECGGWYLGWRGWYGPIVAGDFERVKAAARMHFEHQYTEPAAGLTSAGKVAPFVSFDGTEKRYGYNMHEVFLDHLRSYYWWTGDDELMKELWPKIKFALEYQRREIAKGAGGLYVNETNTWISDGHHYNGNACTQASAYAAMHNRWAADVARLAGEDPARYVKERERVIQAMNERLWIPERGYYAEYVDGDNVQHDASEAATIYHPLEMGAADAFQAYQATRYLDERLWRFGDQILANDWYPVIVTCGLVGFNESLNTALAYYYAGRFERAWRLLKVCCDSTARAAVPGSISCYGSREGEQGVYVDFTDATSMFARTVVEGLFGLQPRVDAGRAEWAPRFPAEWDRARLSTAGFTVDFRRADGVATYVFETDRKLAHEFRLPADFGRLTACSVNGKPVEPEVVESVLRPYLSVMAPGATRTVVTVAGEGAAPTLDYEDWVAEGDPVEVTCLGGRIVDVRDPQGLLRDARVENGALRATMAKAADAHTAFVKVEGGVGTFWAPVDVYARPRIEILNERVVAVPGIEGVGLKFTVRNNSLEALEGNGVLRLGGQVLDDSLPLAVDARGRQEFEVPIGDVAGLAPG
ncbi:MAG: DUF4450 domain-containing protein, partial [Candidatus Hydrogenedentes bacterium]|nr:DUF4450 domain-containing protein [Candidatus Hydrogenedentota bacterium]